ncbi:MAG: hypothetical protein JRF33_10065 [Deltaproteobacteria bacterium]|nr:hypothetical protein [Deltaproteobacteria bacterium]
MSPKKIQQRSREERLHAAAVVKLKYIQSAGRLDSGFRVVYEGVLSDLSLEEAAVDTYIEAHREELNKLCLEGG